MPRALERGIDLGFDDRSTAAAIEGDPFLLREMLNNLLDNAIRYTQSGGQVTVRVKRDGTHAVLAVEDNGPGIPDAERTRVFRALLSSAGHGMAKDADSGLRSCARLRKAMPPQSRSKMAPTESAQWSL